MVLEDQRLLSFVWVVGEEKATYVGCRRVQAGTQPLNMNIGPSFASLLVRVCDAKKQSAYEVLMTCRVLLVPAPCAFMILDLSTSAGEQTAARQPESHREVRAHSSQQCPDVSLSLVKGGAGLLPQWKQRSAGPARPS